MAENNLVNSSKPVFATYPLIFGALYLAVHFIPYAGGIDPMGFQWFYLAIADLVTSLFIIFRIHHYFSATKSVFTTTLSKLYLSLFLLAGLSIFIALNPTEALVCFSRFIITIIGFYNLSILLYGRNNLFTLFAQIITGIVFIESLQTLYIFFVGIDSMPLDKLILSLQGNTGLKNIFAASIVVKIPFVMYCIYRSKLIEKTICITIFILAVLSIFIINARSSYLGLFIILFLYLLFCTLTYTKEKKSVPFLFSIAAVLLPLIMAFLLSQIVLTNAQSKQLSQGTYGTVTERLGSISYEGDGRAQHWENTIDYIKAHPLKGCGYGNWKIASIPLAKTWANDFTVPIHSHNDFLEISAELGMPGGLLYLFLFITLLIYAIKIWQSTTADENKLVAIFSLMALGGYFVDACLNFPLERPIMQVFFIFILAFITNTYTEHFQKFEKQHAISQVKKIAFSLTAILFLLPAAYLSFLSYQSMVGQFRVLPDLKSNTHQLTVEDVTGALPNIPNLTTKGQPIEAIKGSYYYYAKQYDTAILLLNEGIKANPYTLYSEFMKANLFYEKNQLDSACYYAELAFYARPRAKAYFQNYLVFLEQNNDTTKIRKAFQEYIFYRNEPDAWYLYLTALYNTKNSDRKKILTIADTAIKLFPTDATLIESRQVISNSLSLNTKESKSISVYPAMASQYLSNALTAFNKGDYKVAAINFTNLSTLNPTEYLIAENTGICYFNLKEYGKAISWFNKVLQLTTAKDGKSEFFKAKCLLNLGRKEEGCQLLEAARLKKYGEAEGFIKLHCHTP